MYSHVLAARIFDAPQVQDLGATGRHLHHFFIADLGDATSAWHDSRIGGVDPINVCIDFAMIGAQGSC